MNASAIEPMFFPAFSFSFDEPLMRFCEHQPKRKEAARLVAVAAPDSQHDESINHTNRRERN